MCTTVTFLNKGDLFFGRNMDIDRSFGETLVVTPRNYPFKFCNREELSHHYAMIGVAAVMDNYPLYAEACNEKGLCMAGLNFPVNAYYFESEKEGMHNVSPFEFIPWVLSACADLDEAKALISETRLISALFCENLPLAPLHWHIADKSGSFVFEQTKDGAKLYDDPVGILTNNPTFDFHLKNLRHYMNLSNKNPQSAFCANSEDIAEHGFGLGGCGLPGDFSSASRFVRAAFLLENSCESESSEKAVAQVFQLLSSVSPLKGCVLTSEGKAHYTTYCCVIAASQGRYYLKRHGELCVRQSSLNDFDLESCELFTQKQFFTET